MAVDMFLKLEYPGGDGALGESQDARHRGEIEVLAWSWGAANPGSATKKTGGKVIYQDISLTKYVDSATNDLLRLLSTGALATRATLTVQKVSEGPLEYIRIILTDVLVAALSTGGSGGEDRLTENVTFGFRAFDFSYSAQRPDGTLDTPQTFGYDLASNTVR